MKYSKIEYEDVGPKGEIPRPIPEHRSVLKSRLKDLYEILIPVAREHGYALAVHGSLERDLDLIAVPWTNVGSPPATLAKALAIKAVGYVIPQDLDGSNMHRQVKPNGRIVYTIQLHARYGRAWIDLGIMARR